MLKQTSQGPTYTLPGVPAGEFRTVGRIRGTNGLMFHTGQNGMMLPLALLTAPTPVVPAVDDRNEFIGIISACDVLRALKADKDISSMTAEDIMVHDGIAVTAKTTIEEAIKTMEAHRILNLPALQKGLVTYSVTGPAQSLDRPRHNRRRATRTTLAPRERSIKVDICEMQFKGGT